MNLSPWNYWTPEGELRPGHERTLALLEGAIAADSTHPGACHLFIHAVEAAEPERAVPCAERLEPSARGEYELPQAVAQMIADGRVVRTHPITGFWSDLGTPEDLAAAEQVL